MNTTTLSESITINPPFKRSEFIPAITTTFSDLFVNLSNTGIERFVLQTPNPFDAMIHSLHSNKFELKIPMPVTIELIDDDEAIATFPEADIAISGDSPADAMEELRFYLVGLYEIFEREAKNLGPVQKVQLRKLGAYIGETRGQ